MNNYIEASETHHSRNLLSGIHKNLQTLNQHHLVVMVLIRYLKIKISPGGSQIIAL